MGVLTDYLITEGIATRRGKAKGGTVTLPPDADPNGSRLRVRSLGALVEPYTYEVPPVVRYTDTNRASTLQSGESYMDNVPSGVPIINASTISTSRDIGVLLTAADSQLSQSSYIRLDGGVYWLNTLRSYGTNNWAGFLNANRRVMGLISVDSSSSIIRVSENFVASDPAAQAYVLAAYPGSPGNPVPVMSLYFSNNQNSTPLFFSGITFQGQLQKPYSVYSTQTQNSTAMRNNPTAPTPLVYRGMSIWRSIQGARIQFCTFEGFGFSINTAPPFETGVVEANYDNGMVYYRNHIDGRVSASLNAARPRSSGGFMGNKTLKATFNDNYQGYTRKSGFAYNTNTGSTTETINVRNFQMEYIADVIDSFAGDNGRFPGAQLEEFLGTATYEDMYINNPGTANTHIAWAVPMHSAGDNSLVVVPRGRPVLIVKGLRTDDTTYGGCIRIRVIKVPNRSETSPAYTILQAEGIDGSGFFDVRNYAGVKLQGVFTRQYNAAIHTPDKYFIVNDS